MWVDCYGLFSLDWFNSVVHLFFNLWFGVFDDSVRLLFAVDVFTVVFDFGLMVVLVIYGLGLLVLFVLIRGVVLVDCFGLLRDMIVAFLPYGLLCIVG